MSETGALFETRLLRGGLFVASSSQTHFSQICPYPGTAPPFQLNRFALYGRSEGFFNPSRDENHLGAVRNLPVRAWIFTCTWSGRSQ